jgi:protein-L-isoaspartate(D-aspartate) O-methyltransferase
MSDLQRKREHMVERHLRRRGVTDARILDAFRAVPREAFVPEELVPYAYDDTPLPIGEGQTISQPYIVALTIQALLLKGGERVLEIGTGSGYAAAILGQIAKEVYTVERIPELAANATERLARAGAKNVHLLCGDGTLGWRDHAPYDAIAVAAGGPRVPEALVAQLAIGGRLVVPVGPDEDSQKLVRVVRENESEARRENLADVRFVPLIGEQGWADESRIIATSPRVSSDHALAPLLRETCEPLDDLGPLLERIAASRVVLLGEASHGTSEFYGLRARITKELIEKRGFSFVAVEADWPDAARLLSIDDIARAAKLDASPEPDPLSASALAHTVTGLGHPAH